MKFAVISEVCGNLVALQAFLADVAKRNVDFILCLGNFLGFGPRPIECLNIVTGKQFRTTKGSLEFLASESAIAGPVSLSDEEWHMLLWLRNRLSENEQKKLRQLPMKLKIHLTDKGDQSLLMCHTSLEDENVNDSADNTMRIHTELGLLAKEYRQEGVNVLCLGNNSYPIFMSSRGQHVERNCDRFGQKFHLSMGHYYLINPGSIGRPPDSPLLKKDESTYAIIEADGKDVSLVYYRVRYAVELHIKELKEKKFSHAYVRQFE
ncbi:hypothetical protein A2482_00655 [Candidatus Falkowbacteria bacterium RIFOXYC2_FULL_48_21]|uniref:Uncharacterized protein n=1 Tax=Candidatus Falkowbacteria bacterium RIFOXYC2_FULL_48_21 TaxID=1798005 RepID=A0A1F5T5N9_9BACT|nr:MAG: hypothetical protein A2482_00655 [Candidatus Falkowbacteria bacterium RIFOXYC2_FULL_48_21]